MNKTELVKRLKTYVTKTSDLITMSMSELKQIISTLETPENTRFLLLGDGETILEKNQLENDKNALLEFLAEEAENYSVDEWEIAEVTKVTPAKKIFVLEE